MATEDEVIRKRLTVEGDGGSDDKRIMSLVKTFVRWVQSSQSEEEVEATYQKMLFTLSQCEYSFSKTNLIMEMNKKEMERYEEVYCNIEGEIDKAKKQIAAYKEDLQKARIIRKHRQQYDALAKVIQKQPTRQDSLHSIEKHKKTLEFLTASKNALKDKLELRKKQFHLLVQCVHQLQDMLVMENHKEEEEEERERERARTREKEEETEENEEGTVAMDTT